MTEKRLTPVARKLRRNAMEVETLLWSRLRGGRLAGHKFVRQISIGDFVGDFACRSARLIVELDGSQHADAAQADADRTRMIEDHGYTVIRFWNNDVTENLDGVLQAILEQLRIATDR